jgi:hypothetical protein
VAQIASTHRFECEIADRRRATRGVAAQQSFDHAHRAALVDQLICASGARR